MGAHNKHRAGELRVSFVVVVYRMVEQAYRTLHSLSTDYQTHRNPEDYEVIVVENDSEHCLDPSRVAGFGPGFHYYLREEQESTPVHAVNFGAEQAKSDYLAVMIDGARMLSPGVVENILRARRMHPRSIVAVPGYHLGKDLQQEAVNAGYDEQEEARMLQSIRWPEDGYRLFEIACFSGSCAAGLFRPHSESNCLAMPKAAFRRLGGMDPRFNHSGGGLANLDLYKRLLELPDIEYVLLPGEGNFHQFHCGLTTGRKRAERDKIMTRIKQQYRDMRGAPFTPPSRKPIFLGTISESALRFFDLSVKKVF